MNRLLQAEKVGEHQKSQQRAQEQFSKMGQAAHRLNELHSSTRGKESRSLIQKVSQKILKRMAVLSRGAVHRFFSAVEVYKTWMLVQLMR